MNILQDIQQASSQQTLQEAAVADAINKLAEDPDHKVTVLPLMCGTGKSQAISRIMKQVIEQDNGNGLLVVTDQIDRMNSYLTPRDPAVAQYLREHEHQVEIMTKDNVEKAVVDQWHKPILIMSTQRYLNLSPSEINSFLHWREGTRPLILIDEHMPLRQTVTIRRKDFNDVLSMITESVAYGEHDAEKYWCIEQWRRLTRRIYQEVEELEKIFDDNDYTVFFNDKEKQLTDDDSRFWEFIRSNQQTATAYDSEAYQSLRAINQIVCDGSLFHCRKYSDTDYISEFAVTLDNSDKVKDVDAKVIILDATGDIHPDYQQDFVHIHKDSSFDRSLRNLFLTFVDMPIDKSSALEMDNSKWKRYASIAKKYVEDSSPFEDITLDADVNDALRADHGRSFSRTMPEKQPHLDGEIAVP